MREIKFRAWDTDNQKMYYSDREEENGGGLIVWNMGNGIQFKEIQLVDTNPGGMGHQQTYEYRAPNQIIMQYIGLKNKKGREAYEHDVYKKNEKLYIIKWNQYSCSFCFYTQDDILLTVVNQDNINQLEYVGNIHENPELLK